MDLDSAGEALKAATGKLVAKAGPGMEATNAHLALQHFIDILVADVTRLEMSIRNLQQQSDGPGHART